MLLGVREQSVSAVRQMPNDGMTPINLFTSFFPYNWLCNIIKGFNIYRVLLNDLINLLLNPFIDVELWVVMFTQVHARCYGELEPVNGKLWLCNLCRSGAPPPPCCLCPLIGILGLSDIHALLNVLLLVIGYYNWVSSRWCNETDNGWPVGSFGLCHVDTWFVLCDFMYSF